MTAETSNSVRQEAVAQACAYLNDVDLPNVYALASCLHETLDLLALVAPHVTNDPRVQKGLLAVQRIRPHLGANL